MFLTQSARLKLQKYGWPGNIREMRNVLERALMGAGASVVDAMDLDFAAGPEGRTAEVPSNLTLKELERHYIIQVLHEEEGHVDRAAKRLDIPRSTLYQKLKTYGPEPSRNSRIQIQAPDFVDSGVIPGLEVSIINAANI